MTSLAALQDALRKDPTNPLRWLQMGSELHSRARFEQALTCFERAAELAPASLDATYNRGVALQALGRAAEAIACYEAVLAENPAHRPAAANRLAALLAADRHAEAAQGLERALAERHDADMLVNLGLARQALGELEAARSAFEAALAESPGHKLAEWNLALLELRCGELARGLARYEASWPGTSRTNTVRDFGRPLWRPREDPSGLSILLHADEGIGDTIQALRFVPEVARRAARVVLEVPRGLAELARNAAGAAEVIESGSPLPPTDRHAPLHGLALRVGATLDDVGRAVPYLHADPAAVARWRAQLSRAGVRNVGLAWRGNPTHPDDRLRSAPLERLRPLFDVPGVRLVSLQLDPPPEDAAALAAPGAPEPLAEAARGMVATAALVAALDLVVTVDTSIAHLAGALGRPTWVLLAARADWRWLEGRDTSPWYPTAVLQRASYDESWDDVARRVCSALRRFVTLPA